VLELSSLKKANGQSGQFELTQMVRHRFPYRFPHIFFYAANNRVVELTVKEAGASGA
jgi:hypothetical protein